MTFLDGLGKKLSTSGQSVVKKAKDMAGITNLKSQISDEEKKIKKHYKNLGQKYFDLNKYEPQKELEELVNLIKDSYKKINELEEKIKKIENMKICPVCGAANEEGAIFCTGCGAKLAEQKRQEAKPEDVEVLKRCAACGSEIAADAVFCTKCGKRQ